MFSERPQPPTAMTISTPARQPPSRAEVPPIRLSFTCCAFNHMVLDPSEGANVAPSPRPAQTSHGLIERLTAESP